MGKPSTAVLLALALVVGLCSVSNAAKVDVNPEGQDVAENVASLVEEHPPMELDAEGEGLLPGGRGLLQNFNWKPISKSDKWVVVVAKYIVQVVNKFSSLLKYLFGSSRYYVTKYSITGSWVYYNSKGDYYYWVQLKLYWWSKWYGPYDFVVVWPYKYKRPGYIWYVYQSYRSKKYKKGKWNY